MKKLIPALLVLTVGVCIAVAVKANRSAYITCCDDFGKVCAVINGVTYLGPTIRPGIECP